MKKALISGVNGQDGSYLSEKLLDKGYEVHGIVRRSSIFTTSRIDHLINHQNFTTHHGDVTDSSNIGRLLSTIQPDEVYNLAAQSHVAVSFEVPEYTADVSGVSTIRLLDGLRSHCPSAKFYQASTSELFGGLPETAPQSEKTPFHPKSPYGAAKLYSYWITVNYRESYGLFACNGILFNHESPRRGGTFVTKKICDAAAKISLGQQEKLYLGNLDAQRDWGHAADYVEAMWMMLQSDQPKDYVVATGEATSVRAFCEKAFKFLGITIEWMGSGDQERGINSVSGECLIEVDPKYYRPAEVDFLQGDSSLIQKDLGWKPKYTLDEMIEEMVKDALKSFQ